MAEKVKMLRCIKRQKNGEIREFKLPENVVRNNQRMMKAYGYEVQDPGEMINPVRLRTNTEPKAEEPESEFMDMSDVADEGSDDQPKKRPYKKRNY